MEMLDNEELQPAILEAPRLMAPVPRPPRVRDYLTSSQHASKLQMPVHAALEQMPVCYQGNHLAVIGPDAEIPWPSYSDQLDYELEPAIVVGAPGRNVPVSEALSHIAGVTIWNDVSARDIQSLEMSTLVGPSKGKHFCNVIGPCVATLDEVSIDAFEVETRVNGEVWGEPKHWAPEHGIAQVLAWASWEEDLHPGEVLALGTVGQGCGLELDRWIQPGDTIELEMAGVGVLRNVVGHRRQRGEAGIPSFVGAPRRDPNKPRWAPPNRNGGDS
jgi:2-keto-4-pentenoate hydratase/2-oxohepta-3-ene-1,7-dioic acid hydratase in catechol pathway